MTQAVVLQGRLKAGYSNAWMDHASGEVFVCGGDVKDIDLKRVEEPGLKSRFEYAERRYGKQGMVSIEKKKKKKKFLFTLPFTTLLLHMTPGILEFQQPHFSTGAESLSCFGMWHLQKC